jgi:hypothetical protein
MGDAHEGADPDHATSSGPLTQISPASPGHAHVLAVEGVDLPRFQAGTAVRLWARHSA